MGQLKLIPPSNVLSLNVARVLRRKANPQTEAKSFKPFSGATQPPLPLTAERLALIKAYAKPAPRDADSTPVPQRSAYHAQTLTTLASSSGLQKLIGILILIAILPNLTLAAIFWLEMIEKREPRLLTMPPNGSPVPESQTIVPAPVLSAPSMLKATAGETVPLPVALDGTDAVPARSIISISGLPHGSRLSSGRPYGETEWNLKPDEIGDVQLVLPNTMGNEANLLLQLVAPNGGVLAATTTMLKVTAGAGKIPVYPVKTQLIQGQVWGEPNLDAMDEGERPVNPDAVTVSSGEIVPLPARRPTLIASGNVNANWVKSSAFVNLRKGATSSAAVVGVVAKGTKLRLVGRKRGWVEVTNPATSQTGWIYGPNVDPLR
jgi:Bacterial SH3 domain